MPKYCYSCKGCDAKFEVFHSLHDVYTICKICDVSGSLERVPSDIFLSIKDGHLPQDNTPGRLVKDAIDETRKELHKEKDSLKNRRYNK